MVGVPSSDADAAEGMVSDDVKTPVGDGLACVSKSSVVADSLEKAVPPVAPVQNAAIPFLQLFSFADGCDYLLMGVGSIGAIVHGLALPLFFLLFGKLLNGFGSNRDDPKRASEEVSKVYSQPCFPLQRNAGEALYIG